MVQVYLACRTFLCNDRLKKYFHAKDTTAKFYCLNKLHYYTKETFKKVHLYLRVGNKTSAKKHDFNFSAKNVKRSEIFLFTYF